MSLTQDVYAALGQIVDPLREKDIVALGMVRDLSIGNAGSGSVVGFTLVFPTHADPNQESIVEAAHAAVAALPGVSGVNIKTHAEVRRDARIIGKLNIPVKNIIAVASGKGGVGKSTISTNLAVSLALDGAKVGVLDADIYGPNIPMMFGLSGRPRVEDARMVPFERYGVEVISMGFLMPEGEAVVWRGPMLHKAIQQLFTDVAWSELDYMIVDLPPGTGDAQLSLAQSVPLTGGVIITMPQQVSISDARRGATAFRRLEVPILGVIENMAGDVFGTGGGAEAAQLIEADLLGTVELDPRVRMGGDNGEPIVVAAPESEAAQSLRRIARILAARVAAIAPDDEPTLSII